MAGVIIFLDAASMVTLAHLRMERRAKIFGLSLKDRSAIFPTTDAQKQVAMAVTEKVRKSNAWKAPITTTIETPMNWTKAEDYHQDYLVKHPGGYDNHWMREVKF